jgi:hypothetical protein
VLDETQMLIKKFQQILANLTKINLPALLLNIMESQPQISFLGIISIYAFTTPNP